jgi:anti-anti-sigma factor
MPQIERRQNVTVIVLDAVYEALDHEKLQQARDLLLGHAESVEPPLVVLDLSGTAYMGSAFIEVMFRTWKRVHARNGRLVLSGVQPLCHEVLRTTRLDTMLDSFANVDEAIAAISGL